MRWGDKHVLGESPPVVLVHDRCGTPLEQTLTCPQCAEAVTPRAIKSRPGPGRTSPEEDHEEIRVIRSDDRAVHGAPDLLLLPLDELMAGRVRSAMHGTADESPIRPRCSYRSPCCAATSAVTAPSPKLRRTSMPPTFAPTKCCRSRLPAQEPVAMRRCSRWANAQSCATPRRRRGCTTRLRIDGRLPGRDGSDGARRDGVAAPRERRRALCRRVGESASRRAVAGHDDRVAQCRSRLPSRFARQDSRTAPGHARIRRRALHPVHHGHLGRYRRDTRSTACRRSKRSPTHTGVTGMSRKSSCRTSCRSPALPCTRARPCPPDEYLDALALARVDPARGHPPAGAAESVRRLRAPARRRHRRLGRRLPCHRRSCES